MLCLQTRDIFKNRSTQKKQCLLSMHIDDIVLNMYIFNIVTKIFAILEYFKSYILATSCRQVNATIAVSRY